MDKNAHTFTGALVFSLGEYVFRLVSAGNTCHAGAEKKTLDFLFDLVYNRDTIEVRQ